MVLLSSANQKTWVVATGLLFVLATVAYAVYAWLDPAGPRGGSWPGIAFGVLGFALMAFAGLLGVRKKVRTWPLGRATFWMNGHLWLGTLSVPIVLYHTGFEIGYGLASLLMVLFAVCIVSGFYGLLVQQFLPRWMTKNVDNEMIYPLIPDRVDNLRVDADSLVETICGDLDGTLEPRPYLVLENGEESPSLLVFNKREGFRFGTGQNLPVSISDPDIAHEHFAIEAGQEGFQIRLPKKVEALALPTLNGDSVEAAREIESGDRIGVGSYTFQFHHDPPPGSATLKTFYLEKVAPFMQQYPPREAVVRFRTNLDVINCFDHNRKFLPSGSFHEVCKALSELVEERRQLLLQFRLHRWMHGWLFVHVPVSVTLLLLTLVHAVVSLYY